MNIQKKIFWLKNKWYRPWAYNAYLESMEYDKLYGKEKQILEFEKMKSIVEYAYNHVPYYKNYYDNNRFHPSMLVVPEDWYKIPILEKDIVRNRTKDLLSNEYNIQKLNVVTTSGSTGTPLKVYKEKKNSVEVMGWRAMSWWGMDPSDNMAKLHRNAANSFIKKLLNELIWWPTKRAYLNSSSILTDKRIHDFIDEINRKKICWIQGYSSTIEKVADYMLTHKKKCPSIKMIWWTSAPLTPLVRRKIESAYNCLVMNQYGCNEMWNIAIQKKNEPYLTVCSDFVHVDTVDSHGKQTDKEITGDILITDLKCKAFPLIKYRLGDRGSFAMGGLDSKDGYPKLNFVEGRISDNIKLPNGTTVDGIYLTAICDVCVDTISAYQIYQRKDYTVLLKLVLKEGINESHKEIKNLFSQLKTLLEDSVPCELEISNSIPPIKGKKRYIISELS